MNNNFREHGESSFCVNKNIITVVMKGAFNEYGFRSFVNRISQIIAEFKGEKFYLLMDMTESIGGTPELYLEADKYNEWLNSQNMIAKAIVINSIVNLNIYKARVKSTLVQDHKFFDNDIDAFTWLKGKS